MPNREKTILWIDDEPYTLTNYKIFLEQRKYKVLNAYSLAEGKKLVIGNNKTLDLIILDIMMRVGDGTELDQTEAELAKGGYESGLVLARWIKKAYPNLPILVYSAGLVERHSLEWFEENRIRYRHKSELFESIDEFVNFIDESAKYRRRRKRIKTFIVHGYDNKAKLELKNYIQNTLHLGEPVILHEQPSRGRTIIEKFEQEAQDVNLVFILLTPDDVVPDSETLNSEKGERDRT
jgi:CheY-like chemotaxis protein